MYHYSLKIHPYRIEHFQSNGPSPDLLLLDIHFHFHGQTLCILFALRIGWYSSSNGIIFNIVLRDLDLNFEGQNFEISLPRKRRELSQECAVFYKDWCSSSNGTVVNVALCDLDLHFQGQTFLLCIFYKKNVQIAQMFPADLPRIERPPPWSCSCSSGSVGGTNKIIRWAIDILTYLRARLCAVIL